MNRSDLIIVCNDSLVFDLPGDSVSTASEKLETKFEEVCKKLNCNYADIVASLSHIDKYYFSDRDIPEWKFLLSSFYVLTKIRDTIDKAGSTDVLSVKETKIISSAIAHLTKLGIYSKLQPKVPFHVNEIYTETEDIFYQYNILKCTLIGFCELLRTGHLRVLLLTVGLRAVLTGLHQIAYCPLNKNVDSVFTDEVYDRLLKEKEMAESLIYKLKVAIYPTIYVKETMSILRHNAPMWLKKAVSQTLTNVILSPCGVRNIAVAMLETTENDKTKSWQTLDVIFRLLLSCKTRMDFRTNICQQIVGLINEINEDSLIFERLFIVCTKRFYLEDKEMSKDIFVRKVVTDLLQFTYKDYKFKEGDITDRILRSIRLVHAIFVEKTVECPSLPCDMLKPILGVIFRMYILTLNAKLKDCSSELKDILLKYLHKHPEDDNIIFDNFFFEINEPYQILPFRKDINLSIEHGNIMLSYSSHSVIISTSERSDSMLRLLENNTIVLTRFFGYLLRCIANREKYFQQRNMELLGTESEIMNEYFERKLVTYRLLSTLSEDKKIQKDIIEKPDEIIKFIKNITERTIKTNMHKSSEFESDGFQTIFTIIMILHALVSSNSKNNLEKFRVLQKPLEIIKDQTKHQELVDLIKQILDDITRNNKKPHAMNIEEIQSKSELDIILEDICDPLLPVRGHGLMALKKLVERKEKSVMDKKQYILTLFQQSLKNDDSFIYLSAIDGLAAMADVFPDTVIGTLCEEYSDFTRKDEDGHEIRMKLGEVLVRVTKILGEMAPKYKSLLLNTFLNGTKDDDHLVRASSLSNLGEICRVLGYKLGTIFTEVLVCVHAIITTDKAVEARRAAVTVIRQLLTGLESEMISFLKEDILPIYRTLKQIYLNDKDDIMRLQAQLALEELNENMKSFVFPKPQINTDKKIIMLD